MLNLTWELFTQTGNIETYLLYKQLEDEEQATPDFKKDEQMSIKFPIL